MDIKYLKKIKHLDSQNFFLIAGPCAIESESISFEIAEKLVSITDELKIPFVFKGSYKKANRSRLDSFTGIGDEKALKILSAIGDKYDIPVLTDIHEVKDAEIVSKYVDILQIPAFLVRQTDLVLAAARTDCYVNLKKGQFMSPESMYHAVEKVKSTGNDKVLVTERGSMFGYKDMIVDFRGIPKMKKFSSVVLDVTHSLQQPNQNSGITGGEPEMIETISRAGISIGVDGLFLETHPNPNLAKSDGKNMLELSRLPKMLEKLVEIKRVINKI